MRTRAEIEKAVKHFDEVLARPLPADIAAASEPAELALLAFILKWVSSLRDIMRASMEKSNDDLERAAAVATQDMPLFDCLQWLMGKPSRFEELMRSLDTVDRAHRQ